MNDLQYMYVVVYSVPICTVILFPVVHRSTQREFMFVVNKSVFFLLHNVVNKLELQRACSKHVKHPYSVSCTQLLYLTTYSKYSNVKLYCSFQMAVQIVYRTVLSIFR